MSQPYAARPPAVTDPTVDRLYSVRELDEFALRQAEAVRDGVSADPLTDPIPRSPHVRTAQEPAPVPTPRAAAPASARGPRPATPPASRARRPAAPTTLGPRPVAPPAPVLGPRPTTPPATPPTVAPVTSSPRPTGLPRGLPTGLPSGPPTVPLPTVAPAPAARPASNGDRVRPAAARAAAPSTEIRQRSSPARPGAATWGWRGQVRVLTRGLVSPPMGPQEAAYEADRKRVQRGHHGTRTIVFVNPKGGAAKTTAALLTGYTFGTIRGGGVVAWDSSSSRGTLGLRGARPHDRTVHDLADVLGRWNVTPTSLADLATFVRPQGDAHFDVLAADERPELTRIGRTAGFGDVHRELSRFYRLVLVDTGANVRDPSWLAAAECADLLVVTSTVREDTGRSGLWMLDALQRAGHRDLKYKTVTVLTDPGPRVDKELARDLVSVYRQRTRGVYRVPYDRALASGSTVPYGELSPATRRAWVRACAGMAAAL